MKRGLLIGGLVGAILALLTVAAATVGFIGKRSRDMRRGWSLVPVVVTGRALKHGDRISPGALVVRDTPEQFVTGSVVPAGQLGSLDPRLLGVDLPENAMGHWADLQPEGPDPVRECVRKAVAK